MSSYMDLKNVVCLVTGATRGNGKGIAVALGERGATVYITGRTMKPQKGKIGGSLEETAAEIRNKGGNPIPVVVDHSNEKEVQDLFEQIRREQNGRLDVLVNNAYSAVSFLKKMSTKAYYEIDDQSAGEAWDEVNNVGLRNHYICATLATKMMVAYRKKEPSARTGLIVNISSMGGCTYLFTPAYGCGKVALDRMTSDMALELKRNHVNISIISLWPGLVRTEEFMEKAETATGGFFLDFKDPSLSQSAALSGLAVAALASEDSQKLLSRSGQIVLVSDVAREYNIREIDGSIPTDFRSARTLMQLGRYKIAYLVPHFVRVPKMIHSWFIAKGYEYQIE